jgi:hypothetical protein
MNSKIKIPNNGQIVSIALETPLMLASSSSAGIVLCGQKYQ